MKKMKKIVSIMLALVMVLCLAIPSLADDETGSGYTITVENSTAGNTYSAFKILDATYNSNGYVAYTIDADSPWLNIVKNATAGVDNDVKSIFTLTPFPVGAAENDIKYYTVVVNDGIEDSDIVSYFNSVLKNYGTEQEDGSYSWTVKIGSTTVTADASKKGTGGSITLDVGSTGYYFVTSTLGATVSLTTAKPTATVIDKNDAPTLDKWIVETDEDGNENLVKADPEAMGDDVDYRIIAYVPLYTDDKLVLEYQLDDEMDPGLDVEVKESQFTTSTDSDGETHYYLSEGVAKTWLSLYDQDGNKLDGDITSYVYDLTVELIRDEDETTVVRDGDTYYVFSEFIVTYYTYDKSGYDKAVEDPDNEEDVDLNDYMGKYPNNATLHIDYTAHVEEDATFEEDNTATMTWAMTSWNATTVPEVPEKPDEDLTATAQIYEAEVVINKVDGDDSTKLLEGAEFTLTGDNLTEVKIVNGAYYVSVDLEEVKIGETYYYYDVDTGTYKSVKITENNQGDYDTLYTKEEFEYEVTSDGKTGSIVATTDDQGHITFLGLNAGTYTLTETKAPNGYNQLKDSITFTITFNASDKTFSISSENAEFSADSGSASIFITTIKNNAGIELPGTGGMGTTVFYVIGVILVLGAVVILVTRRRMNSAK